MSRHANGFASWDRAIGVANYYARQGGQRYEVRGVEPSDIVAGRAWAERMVS